MRFLDKFLWWVVAFFPNRCRTIQVNGEDYLLRFYIKHSGLLPGLYLHYFYRGDEGRELHNHPFKFSFSVLLTGSYTEHRLIHRTSGAVLVQELGPGSVNVIRANDFHKVILKNGPLWTLFCSWRRVQRWGFWDQDLGRYIDHQEYFSA